MNHLLLLMSRAKIPYNCGKKLVVLKPEEKICVEFADELRVLTLEGRLRCCWFHIPNEGKRGWLTALIMRAMGVIPGCPDYSFLWADGCGVIEFKTKTGKLSPNQVSFKAWCERYNVRYALCRTVDEGLDTLRGWGALT